MGVVNRMIDKVMELQICYLCLQATREGQGSHAHVHEIIAGLQSLGCEVSLFEPGYAKSETEPSMCRRCMEFVAVQRRIWRSRTRYEAIYIRSHFAALPTSIWAKMRGIPTVLEINGPLEDLFLAWPWTRRFGHIFGWIDRIQMKWAKAIITVTPQLRKWVIDTIGHTKVYVVPNGANSELFTPKKGEQSPVKQPYVVFFGAMAVWQGIETMLEAVGDPQWPRNVDLVFIGDGAERAKVERAAQANPRVRYVGKVPYRDMPSFVASALAGLECTPSDVGCRSETGTSALKVLETMSCGVPVIVTDLPGQADLIRSNKCGIVIPPDDSSRLAGAVSLLYSDPLMAAHLGENGRKAVEREHSWEARASQTFHVITGTKAQRGESSGTTGMSCNI